MKRENQNRIRQERKTYVPAKVEVVETDAFKVLCASPGEIERLGGDLGDGEILNF